MNKTYPGCQVACVDEIEKVLFRHTISPDEVAAVVVEPIQGEGGYLVPPIEFHQKLREITRKHGILLVRMKFKVAWVEQVGCLR